MAINQLENLNEALELLQEELTASDISVGKAVANAAEEYDINPRLLVRKFHEKYSVSPDDYSAPIPKQTLARRKARHSALCRAESKEITSFDWFPNSPIPEDTPFLCGKIRAIPPGTIVKIEQNEWAMIGIDETQGQYNVKAVFVGDQEYFVREYDFVGDGDMDREQEDRYVTYTSGSLGIATSIFRDKTLDEIIQMMSDRIVIPADTIIP